MPRQATLDAPGTLHHVIVRGIEKGRIVDDRKDRLEFVERMGQAAIENDVKIYAWALMSNHAHILLRSGKAGLSRYMRRFLTRYAIAYNRRHKRHGYLFQNRFKSIVVDEDAYFQELVRYIHLNPVRASRVKGLTELAGYAWSGHGCLVGTRKFDWQDRDYVLRWFGKTKQEAIATYSRYMREGVSQGERPELVGGGLVRSLGRWSDVSSRRREREIGDERILGNSEFAERVIKEAEETIKHQLNSNAMREKILDVIKGTCKQEGVEIEELRSGSRRGKLPEIRLRLATRLTREYGVSLAEIGRQLGITTSAVSKMLSRREAGLSR